MMKISKTNITIALAITFFMGFCLLGNLVYAQDLNFDFLRSLTLQQSIPQPEPEIKTNSIVAKTVTEGNLRIVDNSVKVGDELVAVKCPSLYKPDLVTGGNRWQITFYDDSSPNHDQWATQGICFRYIGRFGRHERYEWWSDTFPDWNGIATQEGDQIVMHGDYAGDVGHDGMIWDIVTSSKKNKGGGHWWEWREDGKYGRTIGFGNAKLVRVGNCKCDEIDAEYISLSFTKSGNVVENPMSGPKTEEYDDYDD